MRRFTSGALTAAAMVSSAAAQCEEWVGAGATAAADAFAAFDEDGPGPGAPASFVGGTFLSQNGVTLRRIGRWDGQNWSAVGTNVAGGGFSAGSVLAMTVFDDDGPGPHAPALYVGGGGLTSADGVTINGIAKWDGASWSPVGPVSAGSVTVNELLIADLDGAGPGLPVLLAGGSFTNLGGSGATSVARWDGVSWTSMSSGLSSAVALVAFDEDGSGPGGPTLFASPGGSPIATNTLRRWNGASWDVDPNQPISVGPVNYLAWHDPDGPGPASAFLYCGRSADQQAPGSLVFARAAGGAAWIPIGPVGTGAADGVLSALATLDEDGDGPSRSLLVAGFDALYNNPATLMQYDGTEWTPVAGWPAGVSVRVRTLVGLDDPVGLATGARPALWVGPSAVVPAGFPPLSGGAVLRFRPERDVISLSDPAYVTAAPGESASFTVTAMTSGAVITYAWRKDGAALVNGGAISGADTETLTIDPVSASDKGIYECVVATDCAQRTSRPALLDVPTVDDCPVDTNGDQTIDFLDLNSILVFFGQPCP